MKQGFWSPDRKSRVTVTRTENARYGHDLEFINLKLGGSCWRHTEDKRKDILIDEIDSINLNLQLIEKIENIETRII